MVALGRGWRGGVFWKRREPQELDKTLQLKHASRGQSVEAGEMLRAYLGVKLCAEVSRQTERHRGGGGGGRELPNIPLTKGLTLYHITDPLSPPCNTA